MKLQINYLDSRENIIASHVTDDEYTPAEITAWAAWLNDSAVTHPGAPEEWDSFNLVPACADKANRSLQFCADCGRPANEHHVSGCGKFVLA